jgi:hypothetical protein
MIINGVITTIKIGGFWSLTLYNSQLNGLLFMIDIVYKFYIHALARCGIWWKTMLKRCNVNLMLCFKLLDTLTYSYSMSMVHVLRVVAITTTHVFQVCSMSQLHVPISFKWVSWILPPLMIHLFKWPIPYWSFSNTPWNNQHCC